MIICIYTSLRHKHETSLLQIALLLRMGEHSLVLLPEYNIFITYMIICIYTSLRHKHDTSLLQIALLLRMGEYALVLLLEYNIYIQHI